MWVVLGQGSQLDVFSRLRGKMSVHSSVESSCSVFIAVLCHPITNWLVIIIFIQTLEGTRNSSQDTSGFEGHLHFSLRSLHLSLIFHQIRHFFDNCVWLPRLSQCLEFPINFKKHPSFLITERSEWIAAANSREDILLEEQPRKQRETPEKGA